MLWDIHTHTSRYSACGRQTPAELVDAAISVGLDGIVITEHHVVWPEYELDELRTRAGDALVILSGAEVTCRTETEHFGDYLVYGVDDVTYAPRSPKPLIEWVHERGGFISAAHPYRAGCGCGDLLYELDVDAVEVWNPNHDEEQIAQSEAAAVALGVPQVAAGDAHNPTMVGFHALETWSDAATLAELIEAIRSEQFTPRPWYRAAVVC